MNEARSTFVTLEIRNTETSILGADDDLLRAIDANTKYLAQGLDPAFFKPLDENAPDDPQYVWDGYVHFLHRPKIKAAWLPTGLLPRVVGVLERHGVAYKANDLRVRPEQDIPHYMTKIPLWDHQLKAVDRAITVGQGVVVMPPRCFALGTLMLLDDGTQKPVEALAVGDKLIGPDGTSRVIQELHRGFGPLFRVIPRWGDSFVTNGDHVLPLKIHARRGTPPSRQFVWEDVEVSVQDHASRSVEWQKRARLEHRSICFSTRYDPLPLDPYVLGLFLGDGSITQGTPEITSDQPDVIASLQEIADVHGLRLVARRGEERATTWAFSGIAGRANAITEVLRALGLWGCSARTKFVPASYAFRSREERLALLAGLLDCDAYNTGKNSLEWVTASEQLARDVKALCWSVGLCFSMRVKRVAGYDHDYWRCSIMGDLRVLPMRVAKKRITQANQWRDCSLSAFRVEPAGEGSFIGFTVDKDHRFLMPDGCIQHNSGKTRTFLEVVRQISKPALWVAPTDQICEQTVSVARQFFRAFDVVRYNSGNEAEARDALITVVTAAGSLSLSQEFLDTREVLVLDEFHHYLHDSAWGRALTKRTAHIFYRFGMTGTFLRSNEAEEVSLHAMLSEVLFTVTTTKLRDEGFLVPTHVAFFPVTKPRVPGKEYQAAAKAGIYEHEYRTNLAAAAAAHLVARGRTVLVLVATKAQGYLLQKLLKPLLPPAPASAQFAAVEFVSTDRHRKTIGAVLSSFSSREEVKVLIGTSLVGEGTDLPSADALIYARGGKAEVSLIQGWFRVCTASPGKAQAVIVDFADQHHKMLREHARDRWRIAAAEPLFTTTLLGSPKDFAKWFGQIAPADV